MRRLFILLSFVLIACLAQTTEASKLALLVGVDDYTNVSKLECSVNDMKILKDALLKIGFEGDDIQMLVTGANDPKEQPTKENIEREISEILKKATLKDMVFIAFSGHGAQEGKNVYFCPPDVRINDLPGTCVSINDVMNRLDSECHAKFKWMVVDACRNDPNPQGAKGIGEKRLQVIPIPPSGIFLFQSCDKGEQSWEDRASKNGYFTKNFAAALSGEADMNKDGDLMLLEVCSWTTARTKEQVRNSLDKSQVPFISGTFSDFSLNRQAPTAVILPPEKRKAGERQVKTVKNVAFAFRWCPEGQFLMGSPIAENGRDDDETPHEVTLSNGFWMLETEVTQKQWNAIMEINPSNFKGDDNLPVENVTWDDCQKFCKKCAELGLPVQLPTEAQWEYACRAGTAGPYAENLDQMAWYSSNSAKKTHPVKTRNDNAWGLFDMHGNVWEWCQDWYGVLSSDSETDPTGSLTGAQRVIRGGSWNSDAKDCRSANRDKYDSPARNDLGFRVKVQLSEIGTKAGERLVKTVNGVEFAFRWCPPGKLWMGSSPQTEDGRNVWDETQHQVTLTKGFWMLETEITQQQWEAIMETNPSYFKKGPNFPVENVTWNECQEFCKKCTELGMPVQLPTEAQWEYACRAGTTGPYAGNLDNMAWYWVHTTNVVKTKQPNAWGLYDMHGNVWEWCQDGWRKFEDKSVTDPAGPVPQKPDDNFECANRGGSWNNSAWYCRSACRHKYGINSKYYNLGFRVIQTEEP